MNTKTYMPSEGKVITTSYFSDSACSILCKVSATLRENILSNCQVNGKPFSFSALPKATRDQLTKMANRIRSETHHL